MNGLSPARLQGRQVVLDPMVEADAAELFAAADDPELFRYLPDPLRSLDDHRAWVERALAEQAAGRALPYVIRLRDGGAVVGTTRIAAIEWPHRRGEIGWTWIARRVQRTAVNTECKRLPLAYGFDTLGFNRIELKTDSLNARSRAAILRIGATQEGIFRNHMIVPGPRIRHTVYFSIVREEWPGICARLDARLLRADAPDSTAQV
jgi:RimJ/RimL family protein N-acetyltransferase